MTSRLALIALAAVLAVPAATPAASAAPPANDNYADRIDRSLGQFPVDGTTVDATEETGEPDHHGEGRGNTVWYQFVPPADGVYTVTDCDPATENNSVIAVYTGLSVSGLTEVGSNHTLVGACGSNVPASVVTFSATTSSTYKIAVDTHSSDVPKAFRLRMIQGRMPYINASRKQDGSFFNPGETINSRGVSFEFASSYQEGQVPFTSTYECKLDAGAFSPCTAGKSYTGLVNGPHTFVVRDTQSGETATRSFAVNAPPPAAGGGTTTRRPAVRQVARDTVFSGIAARFGRSVKVKRGRARLRLLSAESATGTMKARRKGKTVGRGRFTLAAGKAKTVTLKLTKAGRKALAKRGKVKVRISFAGKDAAGNPKTTKKTVTLKLAKKKRR